MRLLPRVIIPLLMFMLLIGYQNFSEPTPSEWDSETPLKVMQEMQEFQRHDPGLPQTLATPGGGSDFTSVRNNWAEKQSKILLNGFDKRIEDAVNEKLNDYVRALTQRDPADENSHSSPAGSANAPGAPTAAATPPGATAVATNTTAGNEEIKKPRNALKFPRPNAIKYELSDDASINLVANPGDTRISYSQAYNERTKLGIEHTTGARQTQMFLRYDW